MKLIAEIEGEKASVELKRDGERAFAEVGGRSYELEVREPEAGAYLLLHEGRVYECRVSGGRAAAAMGAGVEVRVGSHSYRVQLSDPKRLRGAGAAAGHDAGRAQVLAPMPGKVVRVLVEQGQMVEAGDGLVVVEAMKMQNELKSPKTGTVAELHAQPGATVKAGEVLVVVE
ncbi:MAG: biotin/lipoyl-binding protein [Acidobacteria bacterium]|nr:biotin/lipoyl-binding protein [Acidobacteriota bacterium]